MNSCQCQATSTENKPKKTAVKKRHRRRPSESSPGHTQTPNAAYHVLRRQCGHSSQAPLRRRRRHFARTSSSWEVCSSTETFFDSVNSEALQLHRLQWPLPQQSGRFSCPACVSWNLLPGFLAAKSCKQPAQGLAAASCCLWALSFDGACGLLTLQQRSFKACLRTQTLG